MNILHNSWVIGLLLAGAALGVMAWWLIELYLDGWHDRDVANVIRGTGSYSTDRSTTC